MSLTQKIPEDDSKNITVDKSPAVQCGAHFFGPALPPQLLKKQSGVHEQIHGPCLPDYLGQKKKMESDSTVPNTSEKILIGPELPEHLKPAAATPSNVEEDEKPLAQSSDDEVDTGDFGPSTLLMATGDVSGYYRFRSAQNLKEQDAGETSVKREIWMTELPQGKAASFGLLPRQFKSRIQTDKERDTSVWTDTPGDKERKQNLDKKKDHKETLKMKRLHERDKEMEKLARKAAKKLRKKESLLEMHLKNRKKKDKKETKKGEKAFESLHVRRPFDRNIDLQIRKFDENHKRAILNKSQFLSDRFASGESKFL